MEGLFALIESFIIFYVLGSVLGFGARAVGAGAKTLMEGGSFADNFSNKLQFKLKKLPRQEEDMFDTYGIYAKGDPQVRLDYGSCLIFKLFDKETQHPIISTF